MELEKGNRAPRRSRSVRITSSHRSNIPVNSYCFPVIWCIIFAVICDGALPEDYYPQIEMLEIVTSSLNRSTAVNLMKEKNTDVIIGEDTSATSRILMKCNATYPVQWVYLGDGNPEFTTFTNVKWQDDPELPMSFEAEASLGLLGFQGILREEDTGNYTCRSIQEPAVHSYYYIYVPGDDLFASPNTTNITYTPQDMFVRIPCGVTHPKVSVSLCKKDKNDRLVCPVNGASSFNAKGGFLVNLKKQRNPSGTYVCTANYQRSIRVVEHVVMKEGEKPKPVPPVAAPPTYRPKPGKNFCDPSPCGKQAECSVVDGRAVCYCFRGLNGDPYDECAPGKCRASKDCPRGKFCRQGQCTSDPCNPSPCGKGGDCILYRGQSKCSCQAGYTGLPPNCVKSCTEHSECSEDEACIKTICQSPCPGPCGQNAECRALTSGSQRTAQCSCPTGYLGDPLKSCYKFNSTTPGPWNNCPPGYVGHPPACKKKECSSDAECPYGRKCKDQVCDKGFEESCIGKCGANAVCSISPTSPDPICTCPAGTVGNPMVQCTGTPLNQSPVSPTTWGSPASPTTWGSPASPTTWGDPCFPNPCQGPAECHVVNGDRFCKCPPGFTGHPENCVQITNVNIPLPPQQYPLPPQQHPLPPQQHPLPPQQLPLPPQQQPPQPHSSVFPFPSTSTTAGSNVQCRFDPDCRQGENCVEGRCQNLCNGLCGYNAICEPGYLRKYRSISISTNGKLLRAHPENRCSCPPGHEGNPYVSCMPIRPVSPPHPQSPPSSPSSTSTSPSDPICFPNPCGTLAECQVYNGSPVCSCPIGMEGNPYQECRYPILSPPPNEYTPTTPRQTTSIRTTPVVPVELDYQGHSWGHHKDPPPPMSDGDYFPPAPPYHGAKPSIPTRQSPSPFPESPNQGGYGGVGHPPPYDPNPSYHTSKPPFPPPQSPSPFPGGSNHNHGGYGGTGQIDIISHPPPNPTNLVVGDTPTPKTLGRPMSPLDTPAPFLTPSSFPNLPGEDLRDECDFKNPYADYDMETCGVGRRCERDFRGIKRCVCISPFDCTGPTSPHLGGKCLTSRDCLLSDHICINETCKDPCSPAHSPCADVAHSECRVIEGNVLCTCARGYVGSPASGLDCRPKLPSSSTSPAYPPNVASIGHHNSRKLILIRGSFRNSSAIIHNSTNLINMTDSNLSNSFDSGGDYDDSSVGSYDSEDDDYVIDSTSESESNDNRGKTRYQRRHMNDSKHVGTKVQGKDLLLGQCGFGSGRYCDEKSHCKVIDGRPQCVCKSGYKGEFPYCKPECEKNEDCPETMSCQYHQCMDPCMEEKHYCASNAFCSVTNHTASCKCEKGYVGVPWIQCTKIEDVPKDGCMGFNCAKNKKSA